MAMEQRLQAIQMQLTSSQEQVATLSAAIDNVRAEASNAVRELRENLAAEMARTAVLQQAVGRGGASSRDWTLVSSKEFGGGKFGGGKGESFKIWSKKVKIFLNIKKEGFKKILEAIEVNEENVVDDRAVANMGLSWGITAEQCKSASAKLADFLQTYCGDDALRVVEACGENGLEAWRQLKQRYHPAGGRFELEKLNNMLHRKQCKNLDDLPAAIDILQKDFRNYSTMMGTQFPTEWKIPLLSQLLPDAHRENLKMQYLMGQRDFEKMCDSLSAHANEHRLTEGRGRKDMEVDAVDAGIGKKEYTE